MTQKLSYANVTLPLSPSFLEDQYLHIVKDEYSFKFANFWGFNKPNSDVLPLPQLPEPPEFKLDALSWFTGASRPAFFHTIVNTSQWKDFISPACSPDGFNTPQPLTFFDSTEDSQTITAQMYVCGAARPLNQLGNLFNDLWLLTLTDQRFYWYWTKANITQPSSWYDLYNQIAAVLGITITADTIASEYGDPSSKWVQAYQLSTPALLDAVANQVGQRVVVSLDGSVSTINWQNARSLAHNYINNVNGVVISGGLIQESDIAKYVPASVNTLFLDDSGSSTPSIPIPINTTLSSLFIGPYGSATGIPGYYQTIYADAVFNGSNLFDLEDYADQAAYDWYGWRLVDIDLVYPGIEPWNPTGWEDYIEWTLKLIEQNPLIPYTPHDDPYTKTQIRRGPWTDFQLGNFLPSNEGSGGDCCEFIPEDWAPGCEGSGSGNGFDPISITCVDGSRTLTSQSFSIGIENNQLVIQSCDSTDTPLGPCSPVTPNGTLIPIVQKVCPIFTTICYTDCNGDPQTIDVVTSINIERILSVVPIADVTGCIEDDDTCCGSGSGSGGSPIVECIVLCPQCPAGATSVWELSGVSLETIALIYVFNPNDGNLCRWLSTDLNWDLRYESSEGLWILTNLSNGDMWYESPSIWKCDGPVGIPINSMTSLDGQPNALLAPDIDCSGSGSGSGSGGGGTVPSTCCPGNLLNTTLYVHLIGSGGCGCMDGSYPVTYIGITGSGPTWTYSGSQCGNVFALTLICINNNATFSLKIECYAFNQPTDTVAATTCVPLLIQGFPHGFPFSGPCCTGSVTAIVNGTP